jgi:hypothetical protein
MQEFEGMQEHTCVRCKKKFNAVMKKYEYNPLCSNCSKSHSPTFLSRKSKGYINNDIEYLKEHRILIGGN